MANFANPLNFVSRREDFIWHVHAFLTIPNMAFIALYPIKAITVWHSAYTVQLNLGQALNTSTGGKTCTIHEQTLLTLKDSYFIIIQHIHIQRNAHPRSARDLSDNWRMFLGKILRLPGSHGKANEARICRRKVSLVAEHDFTRLACCLLERKRRVQYLRGYSTCPARMFNRDQVTLTGCRPDIRLHLFCMRQSSWSGLPTREQTSL